MIVRHIAYTVGVAAVAIVALAQSAQAQQPSAATVALATQLIELKGGVNAFDPAIDGVIVQNRNVFLQINPNLTKDIGDVERMMRAEAAPRRQELRLEIARGYASVFTAQELKDAIAFYQTPLGRKLLEGEPKAGEEATKRAQAWIDRYATEVGNKMRAEMKKRGHTEF
jgi:hypothetical protein